MRWIEEEVRLSPQQASAVLAGMRRVAGADGKLDPRELHLVDTFEAHFAKLPKGPDAPPLQFVAALMRALILVALADGEVTETERDALADIGRQHGLVQHEVALKVVEMKQYFVDVAKDVELFRAAVAQVAADAGLADAQIEAVTGEFEVPDE